MSATRIPSHQFFTIHFQNIGVLFQFILSQYLRSYSSAQMVENLSRRIDPTDPKAEKFGTRPQNRMLDALVNLTGEANDFAPLFPWNGCTGSLTALYHYSCLLARKKPEEKESAKLADAVERLYRYALQVRDLLIALQEDDGERREQIVKSLITTLNQFNRCTTRVTRSVTKWIALFHRNENVLLFLLRHQEQFDSLFGEPFTRKVFKKMFPDGLHTGEQFMLRRYGKRGFSNLLPFISEKIHELQS